MVARCSFCDELITAENQAQFFPEDDSYVCVVCQKEHRKTLEDMANHSHLKSTAVGQRPVK